MVSISSQITRNGDTDELKYGNDIISVLRKISVSKQANDTDKSYVKHVY